MKRKLFLLLGSLSLGINLLGCGNSNAGGQSSRGKTTGALQKMEEVDPAVPAWFLHNLSIAERAHPTTGDNYTLNYGETTAAMSPNMASVWYGVLSSRGANLAFGYPWASLGQRVKILHPRISSIYVLEQGKQGNLTVGLLVQAKSVDLANGDYIAFAKGQVIIATNKSGELFYSIYPVKGVSIPSTV